MSSAIGIFPQASPQLTRPTSSRPKGFITSRGYDAFFIILAPAIALAIAEVLSLFDAPFEVTDFFGTEERRGVMRSTGLTVCGQHAHHLSTHPSVDKQSHLVLHRFPDQLSGRDLIDATEQDVADVNAATEALGQLEGKRAEDNQ